MNNSSNIIKAGHEGSFLILVLFVNVAPLRFYFVCSCDLNEERAGWEERRGEAVPRQRQRKDRVDVHIC